MHIHLLNTPNIHDMRAFYPILGAYPTSPDGDIALIRSHIAYWTGEKAAQSASIRPSRGNSYRVAKYGVHDKFDLIVRIRDEYDHRDGVTGYRT